MRIIGIDPGLRTMGWGIIEKNGSKLSYIASGACRSGTGEMPQRLARLCDELSNVISDFTPDCAAVEQVFVNKDPTGALKLGQARAICLLVPAQAGIAVAEYAPNKIKKTVVGVGHADKSQVAHMVKLQLGKIQAATHDVTDALAIAICHAHHSNAHSRLAGLIA